MYPRAVRQFQPRSPGYIYGRLYRCETKRMVRRSSRSIPYDNLSQNLRRPSQAFLKVAPKTPPKHLFLFDIYTYIRHRHILIKIDKILHFPLALCLESILFKRHKMDIDFVLVIWNITTSVVPKYIINV